MKEPSESEKVDLCGSGYYTCCPVFAKNPDRIAIQHEFLGSRNNSVPQAGCSFCHSFKLLPSLPSTSLHFLSVSSSLSLPPSLPTANPSRKQKVTSQPHVPTFTIIDPDTWKFFVGLYCQADYYLVIRSHNSDGHNEVINDNTQC